MAESQKAPDGMEGHQAPTADELMRNPDVLAAMEEAWRDSLADDPRQRHEEGGWIYCDLQTMAVFCRRAPAGTLRRINLWNPPIVDGAVVVGRFHTHPNPVSEGWDPGPSIVDEVEDELDGVPDLIRNEQGICFSGPSTRRGGLAGPAGYPKEVELWQQPLRLHLNPRSRALLMRRMR